MAEEHSEREASSDGFWSIGEWENWSNDLASLLPEDAEEWPGVNPEGAQESIIEASLRHLVSALADEREGRAACEADVARYKTQRDAYRADNRALRAKVARVEALCQRLEEQSPLGVDFEKRHPDVTPCVLVPVREVRAALAGPEPDTEMPEPEYEYAARWANHEPHEVGDARWATEEEARAFLAETFTHPEHWAVSRRRKAPIEAWEDVK